MELCHHIERIVLTHDKQGWTRDRVHSGMSDGYVQSVLEVHPEDENKLGPNSNTGVGPRPHIEIVLSGQYLKIQSVAGARQLVNALSELLRTVENSKFPPDPCKRKRR